MAHPIVEVTVKAPPKGYSHRILARDHDVPVDEPKDLNGEDTGPTPYEYMLGALGACTTITLRMYADRKGWPLEDVKVTLRHEKIHAKDCAECESEKGMVDRIERDIQLSGPLSDEQRERILAIADKCPVHKTLTTETRIITKALP